MTNRTFMNENVQAILPFGIILVGAILAVGGLFLPISLPDNSLDAKLKELFLTKQFEMRASVAALGSLIVTGGLTAFTTNNKQADAQLAQQQAILQSVLDKVRTIDMPSTTVPPPSPTPPAAIAIPSSDRTPRRTGIINPDRPTG